MHETAVLQKQEQFVKSDMKPKPDNFFFSAALLQVSRQGRRKGSSTVRILETLSFCSAQSDIAFPAKSTYRLTVSFDVRTGHASTWLLDKGGGVSLIYCLLIKYGWKNGMNR